MQRGCKNTDVKKIRIHDIRHSHVSLLINQRCDALVLADRLGHEKVSTTLNTYSHMFPHKQQELVDNLQALGVGTIPVPPSPDNMADMVALDIPEQKEKTSGNIIPMPIRKII